MKKLTILILAACCVSVMAQVTNTVAVPAPVDKFTVLLDKLGAIILGITTTLTLLLGWYSKNKETLKKINEVLIKSVATHGSDTLKDKIKDEAGSAGVEPALKELVVLHTATPHKVDDQIKIDNDPFNKSSTVILQPISEWAAKPVTNLPPDAQTEMIPVLVDGGTTVKQ